MNRYSSKKTGRIVVVKSAAQTINTADGDVLTLEGTTVIVPAAKLPEPQKEIPAALKPVVGKK